MRWVLPQPNNPDACCIKGAIADELDNDTIPGLGFLKDDNGFAACEESLLEELKKDGLDLYSGLLKLVNISKWGEDRENEEGELTDVEGIYSFLCAAIIN